MPVWKCILKIVLHEDDWSETYYAQTDTMQAAAALFDAQFVQARVNCGHPATYCPYVRVSQVGQPRNAQLFKLLSSPGLPGSIDGEPVKVAAQYRLVSQALMLRRPLWLRGLRDDDVTEDAVSGADVPSGRLQTATASYFAQMEQKGLQIQALFPITHTDPYDFYPAKSIQVISSVQVQINFDKLPDMTTFKRVILSQFHPKRWAGLKGHLNITNVQLNSFTVRFFPYQTPATYDQGMGVMRVEAYRYGTITASQCTFRRFGSRATKSGPFGIRGRQRSQNLRYR